MFAVDSQSGWAFGDNEAPDEWQLDSITGCSYVGGPQLFVKRGDAYYPSGLMLGKKSRKADPQVCVEAAGEVASAK